MASLSRLSFMSPIHIESNIALVQEFAAQPYSAPPYEAFQLLQQFPKAVFEAPGRHQRVKESQTLQLRGLLAQIMGGEFPTSFAVLDPDKYSKFQALALSGELIWREYFPRDFACYELLINHVIYAYRDNYSGGSVSNALGWIWLSPENHWTASDYAQNLIHEYTHNALFLEEMVHTLFSVSAEVMAMPENRVVSSIRRQPRYFDQTFHAAAVAIVLAEYALHERCYKTARLFINGLLPSLDAMKEKKPLMSKHGFTILEEMISVGLTMYAELASDTHLSRSNESAHTSMSR